MDNSMDTIIVDMGTTGIVYTIEDGSECEVVKSVAAGAAAQLVMKPTSTLHIYCTSDDAIFDEATALERSYFGDTTEPQNYKDYVSQHQGGTEYTFHGLKTVVYQSQTEIHPINAPKKTFDAMQVFVIALRLLKQSIMKNRKDQSAEYRMVFLVPANSGANLKDLLKEYILEVFNEFTKVQKLNDYLYFIKEPVAATLYAVQQLLKGGVSLKSAVTGQSRVVIIDLGGGTADFNVVKILNGDVTNCVLETNNAVFAGGYHVDEKFMGFINEVFVDCSATFKNQCLREFMDKKKIFKNNKFNTYTINFDGELPENVTADDFAARFDGSYSEIYDPDKIQEIFENKSLDVEQKLFVTCFEDTLIKIQKEVQKFITIATSPVEKDGKVISSAMPLDNVIVVGGLSESQYVLNELNRTVQSAYDKAKQTNGFTNNLEFNTIAARSLAIVKGGRELYKVAGGKFTDLIKICLITATTDIIFKMETQTGVQMVQIYTKGAGYEKDAQISQLTNMKPKDQGVKEALVEFISIDESSGQRVEKLIQFRIDVSSGGPFNVFLSIDNGHQLIVTDQSKKKDTIYQPGNKAPVPKQKPNIFVLIDCTTSMEPWIANISENVIDLLNLIQKEKINSKVIFYTDYMFTNDQDTAEEFRMTSNVKHIQQFLESQKAGIENQINVKNDLAENLLPAFEIVVKDSSKNKVVVVIADHCAHTHIGCECDGYIDMQIKASEKQSILDQCYSCQKCKESFKGADWVLENDDKIQDHRQRWQECANKLADIPILFVPIRQGFRVKPKVVDEDHLYRRWGYSILKTHKMLYLMGCNKLKTQADVNLDTFFKSLVEQLTSLIK